MKNIITFLLFLFSFSLLAQEKQVALDKEGKLQSIDKTLEFKLKAFVEYPGFQEARLFQINESLYVLEVIYQPENVVLRAREELNTEQVDELRTKISSLVASRSPSLLLNQEGRTAFLVGSSVISAFYYGTSIAAMTTENGYEAFTGIYLLTTATAIAAPFFLTKNKEMTFAQQHMASYGQTRGIIHGIALPYLFLSDPDYRLVVGSGVAASIAEGFFGYHWATKKNYSWGQSMTVGVYTDFGKLMGLGAGHILGLYDGNVASNMMALSFLAGTATGFLTGNKIAQKDYYTTGDAMILSGAGLLGMALPVSILSYAEPPARTMSLTAVAGTAAGLYIGDKLAQKHDFSYRQGIFTMLSQGVGGLAGMGLGYLLFPALNEDKFLPLSTTLGALAGYALSVRHFGKEENKESSNLSFNLNFNPLGMLQLGKQNNKLDGMPIVVGSIRF